MVSIRYTRVLFLIILFVSLSNFVFYSHWQPVGRPDCQARVSSKVRVGVGDFSSFPKAVNLAAAGFLIGIAKYSQLYVT